MSRVKVLADVSKLPNVTFGSRSTVWWGTVGWMLAEGMTLVVCAFSYLYLRKNFFDFPPRGTPLPSLTVPVVQLVVMAISVVPMWYAARSARALDISRTRAALAVAFVVKIAILVLRWYEFKALNTWWNSNAYGSAAWMILGFHATLLILDAAEDAGFAIILWRGRGSGEILSDVVDDALYWYFTVASWFPLFVLVFLYPRWT